MKPDLLLTNDLILRPPTLADRPAFVDLKRRSGHRDRMIELAYRQLLDAPKDQCVLLEHKADKQLVGYLDWTKPNEPFVEIDPQYRMQGFAGQALDRISRLRDDLAELCIDIETGSEAARSLLQGCGFQPGSGSAGKRLSFTQVDQAQRRRQIRLLDSRNETAVEKQVFALHKALGISPDYAQTHQLNLCPDARQLNCIGKDIHDRLQYLEPTAAVAWRKMMLAARSERVTLRAVSAYRSIGYQAAIIRRKLADGIPIDEILQVNAAPGYSEHHTGLALDITTPGSAALEGAFEKTAAFHWLGQMADRFGFRLSFPRNNKHQIAYEPWHWAFTCHSRGSMR